jgi:hypothetical protein
MTRAFACADEDRRSPSRRDVLAALGLGTATVVATQLPRSAARAADGDTLLLGRFNLASSETSLQAGDVGLRVSNDTSSAGAVALIGEGKGEGGCGVSGTSEHSVGVMGHSKAGPGGWFSTDAGDALKVDGGARVMGAVEDYLAVIENAGTGERSGGLIIRSSGSWPALSANAMDGEGGWRMDGTAIETRGKLVVEAEARLEDPSGGHGGFAAVIYNHMVDPASGGLLVVQPSGSGGPAVDASCPGGIGLRVSGTARFSTCGSATLPATSTSVMVPLESVTAQSHVTVTFVTDPGTRSVSWVERTPGVGFTVHVTPYKGRSAPALPFTYLVVEPAW